MVSKKRKSKGKEKEMIGLEVEGRKPIRHGEASWVRSRARRMNLSDQKK